MKTFKLNRTNTYLSILFFLFSALFAFNANANNHPYWGGGYNNSPIRIDIIDDRGRYLRKHPVNTRNSNIQRAYLEAVKNKNYQVRIRNTSNRRIGVIVAIDGRNILSGKKSYLRGNEKMYVLDPYETANYKGWRTSKNRVHRFVFTSEQGSYANAWGDRSAMGVIAVAVFNEKKRNYRKHNNGLNKRMAPSSSRRYFDESAGTGFGRGEYSPSVNVRFIANSNPSNKYFYKYEWRKTLCKRGIIRCNQYQENRRNNNRFWPNDNRGYAPFPPSYRLNTWDDYDPNW